MVNSPVQPNLPARYKGKPRIPPTTQTMLNARKGRRSLRRMLKRAEFARRVKR